ncbi:MAG: type I secretion C-terminal target domain-containing protein, partial [Leptolyngbyaceae cyanobacterium SL_7_1]|nr:type I secretion C-terminal target domain-containing protein [Leptolyngbyaceae cyanobacterium SL_7_1]
GTYAITASATDSLGNSSPVSAALSLTIDTTSPTVDIIDVTPDPRSGGVPAIAIQFNEAIGNFTLGNLSLTRNGQGVALTNATLTSPDNVTWTLGNLVDSTNQVGSYSLLLRGSASTLITDRAGNLLLSNATEAWQVTSSAPTAATGTATPAIDFRGGRAGIRLRGTSRPEVLRGTNDRDVLEAFGNNDRLLGRGGVDRLLGGVNNDNLRGENGNDRLEGGDGNDRLDGGNNRDLLLGGNGNDALRGGSGDDILVGGAGQDRLTGGRGVDMFTFNTVTEGTDQITDFTSEDLIDLRGIFAQPAFAGTSPLSRFNQFVQLVQVGSNTEIRIDADGSGSGTTFNTLASLTNLSVGAIGAANFVIA